MVLRKRCCLVIFLLNQSLEKKTFDLLGIVSEKISTFCFLNSFLLLGKLYLYRPLKRLEPSNSISTQLIDCGQCGSIA